MTYFNFSTSPVVALHSSASSSRQWQSLKDFLEDRFTVIAPDLPGYGKNKETGNLPGLEGDAAPIIRDIELIGEPVHLVGHSYGGAIALKIAMMRPDLLLSLTVFEPVMFSLMIGTTVKQMNLFGEVATVANSVQNSIMAGDPKLGMADFINYWNGQDAWQSLPDAVQEKFTDMAETVNLNFCRAFEEKTRVEDLKGVSVPTMIMVGLESPVATQHLGGIIAKAIPKAKLAMLPCLGHMAPIDSAEWVNARILHHISEIEQFRVTGVNAVRWVA
jgi:pimeloyl-ACP methyl ester carboxylesterase